MLHCPWDYPGKNAGVGCHSLIQRISLTQGLNLGLLNRRQMLYHLSQQAMGVSHCKQTMIRGLIPLKSSFDMTSWRPRTPSQLMGIDGSSGFLNGLSPRRELLSPSKNQSPDSTKHSLNPLLPEKVLRQSLHPVREGV